MEAVLRGRGAGPVDLPQRAPTAPPRWRSSSPPPTSHYLVMDWASVGVEIAVGLLIAGALGAWVPEAFWQGSSWSTTRRTTSPGLRAELQARRLAAPKRRVEVLELDPASSTVVVTDSRGRLAGEIRPGHWCAARVSLPARARICSARSGGSSISNSAPMMAT